jgi:hypothetical protein
MIYSTTGGEFLDTDTREEYIGYYHYFKGRPYQGLSNPGVRTLLRDIQFGPEAIEFTDLKPRFGQHIPEPKRYKPSPTPKDYKKTSISRYFVKDLSSEIIYEVEKSTGKFYKRENVTLMDLYESIELTWKISGPLHDVVSYDGTIMETGIVETNQRTMALHKAKFPDLPLILPADDLAK